MGVGTARYRAILARRPRRGLTPENYASLILLAPLYLIVAIVGLATILGWVAIAYMLIKQFV